MTLGSPTNENRAHWARAAVKAYFDRTRFAESYEPAFYNPVSPEGKDFILEVVGDLVCDLMHLAAESGVSADALTVQARSHFDAERCRRCGGDNDNGEGWDGLCGNCADRADPVVDNVVSTLLTSAPEGKETHARTDPPQ